MIQADVIVFGASRGIGLGFVDEYAKAGRNVVATYRGDAFPEKLMAAKERYPNVLTLYPLDITDTDKVYAFAQKVSSLKVLILNAGIKGYSGRGVLPQQHEEGQLLAALMVNTVAHDAIMRAFFPLLSQQRDAIAVYMGSKVGQTSDNEGGGSHPYRISKAASHAMMWNWDIALKQEWASSHPDELAYAPSAIALCAGWVKTDMGGDDARLTVDASVSQMKQMIDKVIQTKESNGLLMYDGQVSECYPITPILKQVFDKVAY